MAIVMSSKLGPRAKGQFGPKFGEEPSEVALKMLKGDDFIRRAEQAVIGGCGDERLTEEGERLPLPPVFGGWFSAVIADALSTKLWYRPGMNAFDHAVAMTKAAKGIQPSAALCVHTDTHSLDQAECGCAAIAKAPQVLTLLLEYHDIIDYRFRAQLVQSLKSLLDSGYFQPGTSRLVNELEANGVKKEVLDGQHTGVAFVRNDEDGVIYNRSAFYAWCRQQNIEPLSFFEYSRWSMRRTAHLLTPSAQSAEYFFATADAFNNIVPYAIETPDTLVLDRF